MINILQNDWAQGHFPTTSSVTIDKNRNLLQGSREGQDITYLMTHIEYFIFNYFLKYLFIFIFRDREGREKESERNNNVTEKQPSAASHTPPTGGLASNPGLCPDQQSRTMPNHLSHISPGSQWLFERGFEPWSIYVFLNGATISSNYCSTIDGQALLLSFS